MEITKIKYPVLLIGPAYSGKSDYAPQTLNPEQDALVLATGSPEDDNLKQRIAALKESRPSAWDLQEGCDHLLERLEEGLKHYDQILLDAVNLWLSHRLLELLLRHDLQQVETAIFHEGQKLAELIQKSETDQKRIVLITSENAAGIAPPLPVARSFRRLVSLINQKLATSSPTVISFTAGIPSVLRGA
ncbi:MAG: bifunctional adenosylcobinamide kinase/adenosylcobinamide-phosphate guanylyltransferase [Oligoflexus sp.]